MLRARTYTDARAVMFLERGTVLANAVTPEQLWDANLQSYEVIRTMKDLPKSKEGLGVKDATERVAAMFKHAAEVDAHSLLATLVTQDAFVCIESMWEEVVKK